MHEAAPGPSGRRAAAEADEELDLPGPFGEQLAEDGEQRLGRDVEIDGLRRRLIDQVRMRLRHGVEDRLGGGAGQPAEQPAGDERRKLAEKVAGMAPLTVLGVLHALPRIQDMSEEDGLFVESLIAALAQTGPEAAARLADFVEKRGAKVANPG